MLGTTIFIYSGLVFIRGARGEIANRQPGMMTLISRRLSLPLVLRSLGR
jgi:Cu2+-exporting ATPase